MQQSFIKALTQFPQISTSSPYLILWKSLINICSFIVYIEVSFELFNVEEFQKDNRGNVFFIWRITVISLFLMDMLVSLCIEYITNYGMIVQKPKRKVRYYFKNYFVFDAIVLIYLICSTILPLTFWLSFLVFFRIPSNYYSDFITEEYLIQYQFALLSYRIFKLIIILLYIFNFFACAFFAMGLYSISIGEPTWLEYDNSVIGNIYQFHHMTQYIISYFWSVETLVSMGYGEITPMNQYEIIIGDIALLGCMFISLFVITRILSFQDDSSTIISEKALSVKKFMNAKKISGSLYNEISTFLQQLQSETQVRDIQIEEQVKTRLPLQLQLELENQANKDFFQSFPWIINNFSEDFIKSISNYIKEIYFSKHTKIILSEDNPSIYLILKGRISVVFLEQEIYTLRKKQTFGSYTFFSGKIEDYLFYKTQSIIILQQLSLNDFKFVITQYKKDFEKFNYLCGQIIHQNNLGFINYGCYICQQLDHLTENCQIISIKDQIIDNLKMQINSQEQQIRQQYIRTKEKSYFVKFNKQKQFTIPFPINFDIDKRNYSLLLYQWQPYLQHKQPKMKIELKDLINESLQKKEVVINPIEKYMKKSTVFSQSNKYLFYWQLFIMIVNIWFFVAIPQIIFFWNYYDQFSLTNVFITIRIITLIIFIADFCIQFNINYYEEGILVKNRLKIAKKYLKSNFFFDIIPILMLFYMSASDQYVIVYLFGMIKLIPFYRFQFYLFDKLKILPDLRQFLLILGMLLEILYINHFYGCMFYASGVYMYTYYPNSKTWVNDPTMNFGVIITKNTPSKYLYSTYWAIDAITRIGYGDILPLNDLEFIITDLTVITAVGIVAVNISLIENMRKNSKLRNYFYDNMKIQQFLKQRQCSSELRKEISYYLRYYHRVGQDRNLEIEEDSLQLLPQDLFQELMYRSYGKILSQQLWIGDQQIIFSLSYLVKEVFLSDNENLFLDNEIDYQQCLYYIERGKIELFINVPHQKGKYVVLAHLERGAFFGHYSFLTGLPRKSSAKVIKFASLAYIKKEGLDQFIKNNNQYSEYFWRIREKVIFGNQYQIIGLSCFTCSGNDHLSIDCPLTQIKKQILEGFKKNLREKCRSEFSLQLKKLTQISKFQERKFKLRQNIKRKTIIIIKLKYKLQYIPPEGRINFIVDKL